MLKIRTVLFDLFHTLVDVGSTPGNGGNYTADLLGIDRDRWNRACFSHHHDIRQPTDHLEVVRSIALSIDPTIDQARFAEAALHRQARFDHALVHVDPVILKTLERLRRSGYRLGLLSNASSGEVSAWTRSPLAPLFDEALFSCDCGTCKPELRFYQMALERLESAPGETMFVGDGNSDEHRGTAAAGLHTVLTTYFTAGKVDQARRGRHARWRVAHPDELPKCIAEIERVN